MGYYFYADSDEIVETSSSAPPGAFYCNTLEEARTVWKEVVLRRVEDAEIVLANAKRVLKLTLENGIKVRRLVYSI